MPELPEVETTLRGIAPHLNGQTVAEVRVREHRLRWPVPRHLPVTLRGQTIIGLARRAKYLLLQFPTGTVIIHLGMSGSMRIVDRAEPPAAHDHVDIVLVGGAVLRFRDPRRFGCILWRLGSDPSGHRLLRNLGPEPLSPEFDGEYLYRRSRRRTLAVKSFIMDSKVVVGVGNIYASEVLHRSGIHPLRSAGRISCERYRWLARSIRSTLSEAIMAGGTTLRDFTTSEGNPGYFEQSLLVYGCAGKPCRHCGSAIRQRVINQRTSYYCLHCQR
ncbi:MAG: bifunctional DNA-formamidopyrimidine glycosylase/DNA-(apurinic or apyrimidinic site) lyase [Gammaproteobacteria bacterium]|nr:bifunctional DNA-formamidopyrimidine glycosylase/DNA-(apurinic or apyrimidinic site) lyase [Gammaproteobacteria bacterium]MDH3465186.1 bifunctional DNA-formamidopyrimidine glycosylase/DNA-(apurinic or apyrimidinic site) lyase [Gammaproteobacteria bacterium]